MPDVISTALTAFDNAIGPVGTAGDANNPQTMGVAQSHTDWLQFSFALVVLVVLTLTLPKKWGIWLPPLTLLAYGANNKYTVNKILKATIGENIFKTQ